MTYHSNLSPENSNLILNKETHEYFNSNSLGTSSPSYQQQHLQYLHNMTLPQLLANFIKSCFIIMSTKIKTIFLIIGVSAISFMIGCNYTFFVKSMYYNDLKRDARFAHLKSSDYVDLDGFILQDSSSNQNQNMIHSNSNSLQMQLNQQSLIGRNTLNNFQPSAAAVINQSQNNKQLSVKPPNPPYKGSTCNRPPAPHSILSTAQEINLLLKNSQDKSLNTKKLDENVMKRFNARRNKLQEQCNKLELSPQCDNTGGFWPLATKTMIIDYPNHLTGCLVHKSASSSWHKIFWDLYAARVQMQSMSAVNSDMDLNFIPNIAYSRNYQRSQIKNVGQTNWVRALNDPNFIRFMTARHPLARLYSAWNQNLRKDSHMSNTMFRSMRLTAYKIQDDETHVISWHDFIRFFSANCLTRPNLINVHFRPIARQCGLWVRVEQF